MDKQQEKQLITQAQKDPQAFGAVFDEYYEPIFGYILKRTGNVHAAQDIASETFFKALDRLWQFKWRGISISSWLYRIATNEINQYFRAAKKRHYSLEALLEKSGIELADERDLARELMEQEEELERAQSWKLAHAALRKLPEKYQEVLSLRYFEDKKISEIASILGKREGTVKSLLSRGTALLHKKMPASSAGAVAQPKEDGRVVDAEGAISPAPKES
ncbi:MAG: sigma-70 family RNA polymerase sigma factor [Parcubacteria group bacterium]|nr:sigma-70 family RNA polymerase sigma factor [Parcubacteria group bacterium]